MTKSGQALTAERPTPAAIVNFSMRRMFSRRSAAGIVVLFFTVVNLFSCTSADKTDSTSTFQVLESKTTGLDFSNDLTYDNDFNLLRYIYFYNGSGVASGDFNNDGKIDLYFGANQKQSRLYLNEGEMHFRNVTKEAGISDDKGWTTGVSVADVNADGLLDIYVCRVGYYESLRSKNQLLICTGIDKNGVPHYKDEALQYGLEFSGLSTQAAFFDYDLDGDLDMFLLNHSANGYTSLRTRKDYLKIENPLVGARLFRNEGTRFSDATKESGINNSILGYGLGIAVADINMDGYPDVYIGNDFYENDYLYINQKNGTFKEESENQLMHTSHYSMGVDVADVNNDAFPEVISLDMLPSDPAVLKMSSGEDDYDLFNSKLREGYSFQYSRNNLQLNRRSSLFSETGLYSGIAASDWSWAPLWLDFDNDGLKDLFISNGIPKKMNDIDYINYLSNTEVQMTNQEREAFNNDVALIKKLPEVATPNKFYKNKGNLVFEDGAAGIANDQSTFSNGAVYADFDNDGDLDIVVTNINAKALIYQNTHSKQGERTSLTINLVGDVKNKRAIGAKVIAFANGEIRTYEKFPVKGFLSSMDGPLLIGLTKATIDSMLLIWPDNSFQKITIPSNGASLTVTYQKGLPLFDYSSLQKLHVNKSFPIADITQTTGINYVHRENMFVDFNTERLIPHMVSTEGPALAVADVNHDRLDDVFIGSAKDSKSVLYIQQPSGKFVKTNQPALDKDSAYESVSATWSDINNDGHPDLIVVNGVDQYYDEADFGTPRIYFNDGKGLLTKAVESFSNLNVSASTVEAADFNKDGFPDLFVGARSVSGNYGKIPQSYLLQNNGKGKFTDVTKAVAKELSDIGFVTHSSWFDIDKDGDQDLIISLEWGGIYAFINTNGSFQKQVLTDKKGWWNFVLPYDFDGDGDIDLVAGNLGENSRLKASQQEPVKLYYNDFDGNGNNEQIMTYYVANKEILFAGKGDLDRQLPFLKKKFLYAKDFAKASVTDLFGQEKLAQSTVLSADYFSNSILINEGNLKFSVQRLPWQAQLSSLKDAVVYNANNDSLPDILLIGNYYDNNTELGRNDADFGTVLINNGNNNFMFETLNGVAIKGQARRIKKISTNKKAAYIIARNYYSILVIQ
ncbi:VCBS repeat-containing protein [Lacibacter sp.]|uniref:VCBS repeat-containing protein n=1 Tax=Lacibacter sp. TaxID=1915409 RepID=UPI002B4B4CAE|nr:VCBS repeat-containing protein [Lacibacter sp.]